VGCGWAAVGLQVERCKRSKFRHGNGAAVDSRGLIRMLGESPVNLFWERSSCLRTGRRWSKLPAFRRPLADAPAGRRRPQSPASLPSMMPGASHGSPRSARGSRPDRDARRQWATLLRAFPGNHRQQASGGHIEFGQNDSRICLQVTNFAVSEFLNGLPTERCDRGSRVGFRSDASRRGPCSV
jgi:hypothetical protein